MSDALGFAEIDGQQVELLPARTVLSGYGGAMAGDGGEGGTGGSGHGQGGLGINALNINLLGTQGNSAGDGFGIGGPGGSADGGDN